jgi:hypothetical protein
LIETAWLARQQKKRTGNFEGYPSGMDIKSTTTQIPVGEGRKSGGKTERQAPV